MNKQIWSVHTSNLRTPPYLGSELTSRRSLTTCEDCGAPSQSLNVARRNMLKFLVQHCNTQWCGIYCVYDQIVIFVLVSECGSEWLLVSEWASEWLC
jgi:hypothetical protein